MQVQMGSGAEGVKERVKSCGITFHDVASSLGRLKRGVPRCPNSMGSSKRWECQSQRHQNQQAQSLHRVEKYITVATTATSSSNRWNLIHPSSPNQHGQSVPSRKKKSFELGAQSSSPSPPWGDSPRNDKFTPLTGVPTLVMDETSIVDDG
ncbi:hypothetical protein JAAARDRAFT_584778 [Jaapia argillacea MUCL 33604]|uniref:Uncharacterized protein n=1 Tax=Jaapia argillacea MUCL 33604 TaxID=933084 RepID=A0A067PHH3_9AGAM|nr:hypothetical protein JAAARDRAFT_584778 [Jaapia argillacea MUCL 33604]